MGNNIHILNHPLLQHKLSILRDEHTGTNEFRKVVSEIASLMTYEATRDLPTRDVDVKTPVDVAHCKVLAGKKIAIVPILRAGLGMVDGVLEMLPTAKVGHIGLYRDPDIAERDILIVDPMLATGGSASAAIDCMKNYGCKSIKMMNIIAAPEGAERISKEHPDVDVYVASMDLYLNDHGYIVPGLGDAGDRIFGTK